MNRLAKLFHKHRPLPNTRTYNVATQKYRAQCRCGIEIQVKEMLG